MVFIAYGLRGVGDLAKGVLALAALFAGLAWLDSTERP
jgi:hypothetical protein